MERGKEVPDREMTNFNYDAAGVGEKIAHDKMRSLDYDVIKASVEIAAGAKTIYDYNAQAEAERIIDAAMPDTLAEAEAEDIAGKAWKDSLNRNQGIPNY